MVARTAKYHNSAGMFFHQWISVFTVSLSLLAAASPPPQSQPQPQLRDLPIVGDKTFHLDGAWEASSPSPDGEGEGGALRIPATVPGDIVSDLNRAGLVGNPLFELNWLNSSLWAERAWSYRKSFQLPPDFLPGRGRHEEEEEKEEVLLVLDGVKMGATVSLNGVELGTVRNQFLRHTFPILQSGALQRGGRENTLTVAFDRSIDCEGRFMGATVR